jgi:hypothetical protein
MDDCWARPLGGCSSKLSREHYVSQSLWPGASIDVVGLPWCRDEPRRIGLASLTAKILCDVHNAALSPLDAAAGAAMNTLRRVVAFHGTAGKLKKGVRFEIDGPLLERWFLKTAIGILHVQRDDGIWRHDGAPLRAPSEQTVGWAYGLEPIKPPLGLYIAADVRGGLEFHDSFEGGPLYYFDQGLIGFLFRFYGLRFLLWLADPGPPSPLLVPWKRGAEATARDLHRHMGYIRFAAGKRTSHYLDFVWPDRPLAAWLR